MTSWDALEAYLLDLVRKVGGVAYVLRDSGGRHLAPRPPPPVDRRAIVEAAFREGRRADAKGDKEDRDDDPVKTALYNRDRALARYNARIERFKPRFALLDEAVGVDFVRKGPGKRYVHREAALPFIAERYLSSYLLIIAFRDVDAVDAQGVVLALERARSVISDMLGDLPPDDGGDRAIAQSQRT